MLGLKIWSRSTSKNKIRRMASEFGIESKNKDKTQLIRSIQRAEGNNPCFATANGWCKHEDCCFRNDCLKK